MATWGEFAEASPELAAFGAGRFESTHVAYLATERKDGWPRVHPVSPIIGQGHLYLFMEPTSPKGHDLLRDGRYALHSSVSDSSGASGEFSVSGKAVSADDPAIRAIATEAASYTPEDRYIMFELTVQSASSTVYENGRPVRRQWREEDA